MNSTLWENEGQMLRLAVREYYAYIDIACDKMMLKYI